MDVKTAVITWQYAERLKAEIISVSKMLMSLPGYEKGERPGARRMLIAVIEEVRADAQIAAQTTGLMEFTKAGNALSEVISLTESDQFGLATERAGEGVSAATTAAQRAWEVLSSHGIF
ncbi:MAG: hypothetical protein D5R99_07230 [Methanocalculus sp. MSAO_Arc1]|uniref:hypothetical protein n=1 Tax=Methanocalculus TaxID=71151 RepID=UPI000FF394E6|nr:MULTISPECIES: hypothetical protein [unclassified Methanocalculus]MCP1663194.1 hypothetical protein [Methanocalculus sp. AMF5]RQD79722.1 MAG: hypothetical protein D5R99_07230 [Methanocalculus sp. MSAO_Arc1]